MLQPKKTRKAATVDSCLQGGFSLLEMMVSLAILLIVITFVMTGMSQLASVQSTIANRTEMHRNVRSATEAEVASAIAESRLPLQSSEGCGKVRLQRPSKYLNQSRG